MRIFGPPHFPGTLARSLCVHRASFGSVGKVLQRVRCDFAARSAPATRFLTAKIAQLSLQKRHAARAKPSQNVCTIGRRAPRSFWQARRSLKTQSVRVLRAFGADKTFFDGRNRGIVAQFCCAARAKPLQNTCTIGRRAPRCFWQARRSLKIVDC